VSYKLVIRQKAAQEAIEIYLWMETRKPGRGDKFFDSLDTCYAYLQKSPAGAQVRTRH
jgi:plasmid stabilization system protein ParE